jgi:hypothetical protein
MTTVMVTVIAVVTVMAVTVEGEGAEGGDVAETEPVS